jgi:hypothetical protein
MNEEVFCMFDIGPGPRFVSIQRPLYRNLRSVVALCAAYLPIHCWASRQLCIDMTSASPCLSPFYIRRSISDREKEKLLAVKHDIKFSKVIRVKLSTELAFARLPQATRAAGWVEGQLSNYVVLGTCS